MGERITILDYGAGNLASVRLAVEKLGREALVTSSPEEIVSATRLIFPGVGAAPAAMEALRKLALDEALVKYAGTGKPLFGICLGAQVILDSSEEGDVRCLGLVRGATRRLAVPAEAKVPQMGWNAVDFVRDHPLWQGVESGTPFYFVHSYAPAPAENAAAIGRTDYYVTFVSALAQDNIVACQFHPERSGRVGLKVLENFLTWNP